MGWASSPTEWTAVRRIRPGSLETRERLARAGTSRPYGEKPGLAMNRQRDRGRRPTGADHISQKSVKFFSVFNEKTLDNPATKQYTNKARAKRASCDEAGDCSRSEVTSVEYVRCRAHVRHTIGRLKPVLYTRISHGRRLTTGCLNRFVFRTWPDTHGCVYRNFGFIRTF